MIASLLIALLTFFALSLGAAIVGMVLRPRCELLDEGGFEPAARCGNEDLNNCGSPVPSGEGRTAAGRMYAMPPSVRMFFRRAL